ncbi:MAG TPA: hypothetical protein VFF27_02185 [Bacteroidia bacterium]|jgi:mono/diheme cytochrome c family protein|nr:hypothetical protein [Bacteroidia bacterium]
MISKSFYFGAVALSCALFIFGCKTTTPATTTTTPAPVDLVCATPSPTYAADIEPIFTKHCNNCHGARPAGGYNFKSMNDIIRSANNGELLGTIKWEHHYPKMPEGAPKLDDVTINKIECWIKNGMK